MDLEDIIIRIANENDAHYAVIISEETFNSAIKRGTGISKRSPESIIQKMTEGKAVLAVTKNGDWVGFSYIEIWANGEFVSHSGLIVAPAFRQLGIAKLIKNRIFVLSREKYPEAKLFSISTGLAIMKMNATLGFETVTFNELPDEPEFWQGCKSCINYSILQSKHCKNCLCTAMLYTPANLKKHCN